MYMDVLIFYACIYIYIYIYRERERGRYKNIFDFNIYKHLHRFINVHNHSIYRS